MLKTCDRSKGRIGIGDDHRWPSRLCPLHGGGREIARYTTIEHNHLVGAEGIIHVGIDRTILGFERS